MKHTKEPWRVSSHGYRYEIVSGEEIVAVTPYEIPPEERKLSNALLMAAAPELLEALRSLLDAVTDGRTHGPEIYAAASAIAKAEGKEGADHASV